MGGIINENDGLPLGTTRDMMTISDLRADLRHLQEVVKRYLRERTPENLKAMRDAIYGTTEETPPFCGWRVVASRFGGKKGGK